MRLEDIIIMLLSVPVVLVFVYIRLKNLEYLDSQDSYADFET